MDSNKKKTNELLNLDIDVDVDETITIDNLKDFDLDAHFDSDLNLNFDLELEGNNTNSKIYNPIDSKAKNNKEKEEDINENQFEELLSGFKDKYDTNNKKLSKQAIQKHEEEKESTLLINSVIKEHKKEITGDTELGNELDARQYDMLLKNIQMNNKQNIEGKQLNKFQKILGINDSEIEESYKSNLEKTDGVTHCSDTGSDTGVDTDSNNYKEYLDLLIRFYLDFENCDFKNNSQLFFLVSKLENYKLVTDTSELKNGDIIKYPVVKYDKGIEKHNLEQENYEEDKSDKEETTAIPDLIPVFFIKKNNNKLKVSKCNNNWLIWEDIPLFKKIND
jgi:hypothetical protein